MTGMKAGVRGRVNSAGTFSGQSCPPGMVKIRSFMTSEGGKRVWKTECSHPRSGGANTGQQSSANTKSTTVVNNTTTINPNFNQTFTPQVSPNMQVNTGSGGQNAATAQRADNGVTGKQFAELMRQQNEAFLTAQRAAIEQQRASDEAARRRADENARNERAYREQLAADRAASQAKVAEAYEKSQRAYRDSLNKANEPTPVNNTKPTFVGGAFKKPVTNDLPKTGDQTKPTLNWHKAKPFLVGGSLLLVAAAYYVKNNQRAKK